MSNIDAPKSPSAVRRVLLSPAGIAGLVIVGFWVSIAIFGPLIFGERANTFDAASPLAPPSWQHPLGTDSLGRDLLARVMSATQLTFLLTFGAVILSLVLGIFLGLLAAVLGRPGRQVLYQVVAASTAFPSIILSLLLASLIGRSGVAAMLGLAIAGVPFTARLVLTLTSNVSGMDYVSSARMLGVPPLRLMNRYILPNVAEPIVTLSVVTMGSSLLMMSALSFLGIGVQLPEYDWGVMITEGMSNIYTTPWTTLGPALAIITAGIGFSLLGEKLAELLDPRGLVVTPARLARRLGGPARRGRRGRGGSQATTAIDIIDPPEPSQIPEDAVVGVQDLHVHATSASGETELVRGITFYVRRGERVGIVGESGSGKSLTLAALAHMLPGNLKAEMTSHTFCGADLRGTSVPRLRELIGAKMPMVFQDPMSSLNPALTIGRQMNDKLHEHTRLRGSAARQTLIEALVKVGIPEPEKRLRQHPHELSGGQRQRVMIAMATLADPLVILADEPTTALDVSVQAQVMDLLRSINERNDVAVVLVSHDLALVSQVCDRIVVMFDGRIVEEGRLTQVLGDPQHPYTRALLGAVPDLSGGTSHRLTTVTDYSWNTDAYRATHPTPRHHNDNVDSRIDHGKGVTV